MTLATPALLLLLAVPALLAVGYAALQRQRRRRTVTFTDLDLVDAALTGVAGRSRHVGPALALATAALLALAAADPTVRVERATAVGHVYLAVDVSVSMAADDVAPSRLDGARRAATAFLEAAAPDVAVGLVLFAGSARLAVAPTTDRAPIAAALAAVDLGPGTATGGAIAAALGDAERLGLSPDGAASAPVAQVVLLSDGARTAGPDPLVVAERARSAGVQVSTVALGTPQGTIVLDGRTVPVPVDTATLDAIAAATGGRSTTADSVDDLVRTFDDLARTGVVVPEDVRIAPHLAATALVLLAAAALALARWSPTLP